MQRQDRIKLQMEGDEKIRKDRKGVKWIIKQDSLNDRARKLGIATDMPALNRESRRRDLIYAVKTEIKTIKKLM